jgi:hypothetical protein
MFRKAKQNLEVNDDWTLAQTLFGVTTHYRREEDGSLSIKMEGRLEGTALFEQVAILREVDLHYKWAPFCSSSLTIAHLNKLDTVGWFVVGLPHFGLMRDACFRAMGCDSIYEDGSILLVGQGLADQPQDGVKSRTLQEPPASDTPVRYSNARNNDGFEYLTNDPILQQLDLPDVPKGIGSGRMTIRTFQAIIHIESPTEASTRIVANVNPNLPLIPQSLIDFLMKKLCGVLLAKLQNAAKKVAKDPIYNDHAHLMRIQESFYKGWLMEKFRQICKLREWTMPPVTCFELTEQQLEQAEAAFEKKNEKKKKNSKKAFKLYSSMSNEKLDDFLERKNSGTESEPNMATPRLRAHTDSDSMSDLSQLSGSTHSGGWGGNPIAKYLKDLEEKTANRKLRDIEKERERAANRLKPKELDETSRSRLQELRVAREQRLAGKMAGQKPVVPKDATKSQRKLINSKYKNDWVTMWTNHSSVTRIFLLQVLVISLFVLLYSDSLFETFVARSISSGMSMDRKRDIAAILYLFLSTGLHFCLGYIALMYAFSSLQLGMIAGRQATRYYSQNVHLIVAVSSGTMLFASIAGACWRTVSQWVFSKAFCSKELFKETGAIMGFLNDNVYSIDKAAEACEDYEIESWRKHAYSTIRFLFTYTSTFLLSVLILFNVTAKSAARSTSGTRDRSDTLSTDGSDLSVPSSIKSAPLLRDVSSNERSGGGKLVPSTAAPGIRRRANTFAFDTIEEGSQEEIDMHSGPTGNKSKSKKPFALPKLRMVSST